MRTLSTLATLLLALSFVFFVPTSKALALEERDWKVTGDGLITFDPQTKFEWLDLTESENRSYDDIVGNDGTNEFTIGGDFEGFRYATASDLDTLWFSLGWSGLQTSERTLQDGAMALEAFGFLGITFVSGTTTESNGIFFEETGRPDLIGLAQILFDTDDNGRGFAYYRDDLVSPGRAAPRWGSYLVRDVSLVPIPAALPLFASALIGFGFVGYRQRRKSRGQ